MQRDYEAGMTLRALALKYGSSKSVVSRLAKKHEWGRGQEPGQQGQGERLSHEELKEQPDYAVVRAYAHRLLERVGETLDSPKPIAARDLRSISSTLLDVRQLLNAISPIEAEEQRLRIEGLRRQAEETGVKQASVTVQFVDTEGAEL